jgi:hypothetical protein
MAIFPGLSSNTTFATRGYDTRSTAPTGTPYSGNFTVSYDAASNSYSISGPISGRFDELVSSSDPSAVYSDASRLIGGVRDTSSAQCCAASLSVLKPGTGTTIALTYSTVATMRDDTTMGLVDVAFGFPTPAANVPVSGNATYLAGATGRTDAGGYHVFGTVQLNFDFGAGTLSGYFDPKIFGGFPLDIPSHSLGRYSFTNTVYSRGSTTFSGSFVLPSGVSGYSAFDGQFTGPAAQELIARFQAPFAPPLGPSGRMYGVWIGGKQ